MADRSIVNALMAEPEPQPTLADVVRNFLAAPRMQQMPTLQRTPGEGLAPLGEYIKSFGSSTPREPNAIDNALSYVPPDVLFAMNFLGPKAPIPKHPSGFDTSRTWYRGRGLAEPPSLAPGRGGHHFGDHPDALFFSSSPDVASEYAASHAFNNEMKRINDVRAATEGAYNAKPMSFTEKWWTGRPAYKGETIDADWMAGANVMPVYANPGRQAVIDMSDGRIKPHTMSGETGPGNIRFELNKLREEGYDTVLVRGSPDVPGGAQRAGGIPDELVVFPRDGQYPNIRPRSEFGLLRTSSDPVPVKFRGRAPESPAQKGTRDDTGAWFLEGDKPVYSNASRAGLDALFGPEYAKRFDAFRRIDIRDADGHPHSYWLKPDLTPEQARAFNELALEKQSFSPSRASNEAWDRMHRLQGSAFGYPPDAIEAWIKSFQQ